MIYLTLSAVVAFIAVFLKGFQHKNVIGGHIRSVFFTSYAMAVFDVLTVTLIIHNGLWSAVAVGVGASFGMVTAIKLHDKIYKE